MHGKTSEITHDARGIFAGLPSPFSATRYHSLCLSHDSFPAALRVNAASEDGVIQAIEHRERALAAVQFHPESVLTGAGPRIANNVVAWMRAAAGVAGSRA
jgi:anthranilate/para-aminobenzoate synthase component II